ncbi:hypothetical protein E2C01_092526 [Portunus trituberculatus]|uniref:Uncharacterized protein n=1 Tax=Portunus trituberculatus TaxID=210409 RepID=A0A5B7JRZ1_PORTR|nr:hypothetical protein [Portunus trituberculatus]
MMSAPQNPRINMGGVNIKHKRDGVIVKDPEFGRQQIEVHQLCWRPHKPFRCVEPPALVPHIRDKGAPVTTLEQSQGQEEHSEAHRREQQLVHQKLF